MSLPGSAHSRRELAPPPGQATCIPIPFPCGHAFWPHAPRPTLNPAPATTPALPNSLLPSLWGPQFHSPPPCQTYQQELRSKLPGSHVHGTPCHCLTPFLLLLNLCVAPSLKKSEQHWWLQGEAAGQLGVQPYSYYISIQKYKRILTFMDNLHYLPSNLHATLDY